MLRIGICDDESSARERLHFALEKLLQEENIYYEFSSGEGLLGWLDKHAGGLDLLFLDVEMTGLSGLETAHQIREKGHEVLLAFVTGYPDFVFDGYTVGALDYLVKPVNGEKLASLMERVKKKLEAEAPQMFTINNTEGFFRLPLKDILYCYSERRIVNIVTALREYPFYAKLDEVEEQLGNDFVRIHQRYLVSVREVTAIEREHVRIGDIKLPMSRSLKQEATLALSRSFME